MKIRLEGTDAEITATVARVYLTVTAPAPGAPVQADAERVDRPQRRTGAAAGDEA